MGKRARTVAALPPSLVVPPGRAEEVVTVVFGHNADVRKVLMQMNVAASELILDPDAADHMAAQLVEHAKLARGRVQ